jgi:hypothetical protein
MKNFTLFVLLIVFSVGSSAFAAPATQPTTAKPSSSGAPKIYIMKKHGRLLEYNHGTTRLVKKDVHLVNESTLHVNGKIDAGSGQSLELKEGQYMTMDGRIRNLKDMPKDPAPKPKPKPQVAKKKTTTTPATSCALKN